MIKQSCSYYNSFPVIFFSTLSGVRLDGTNYQTLNTTVLETQKELVAKFGDVAFNYGYDALSSCGRLQVTE